MKTTTLGELGWNMPIGVLDAKGHLQKSFKLKPFRMKEEKKLGELREKGGMHLGRYVSQVLAVMVEEVGGEKLEPLSMPQRILKFGGMFMADVLYIYVALRLDALGEDMKIRIPCPKCRETFDFIADLRTLDVGTIEEPAEAVHEVTLKHGFPYQGATRKQVTLNPVQWQVFESKSTRDIGALQAAVIQNSIVGVDGVEPAKFSPIPESSLDEITKRDIETISKALDDRTPGPQMIVTAECTRCASKWTAPIDWGYDNFFHHSSL